MNVNIDFITINHAALMDSGCQLTTSHKHILPAKNKMAEGQKKDKLVKKYKQLRVKSPRYFIWDLDKTIDLKNVIIWLTFVRLREAELHWDGCAALAFDWFI